MVSCRYGPAGFPDIGRARDGVSSAKSQKMTEWSGVYDVVVVEDNDDEVEERAGLAAGPRSSNQ